MQLTRRDQCNWAVNCFAIARTDYEQRRERQAQAIDKAKAEEKCEGRPVDADLHKRVPGLLKAGLGIRATALHADCTTTVLGIRDSLIHLKSVSTQPGTDQFSRSDAINALPVALIATSPLPLGLHEQKTWLAS